MKAVLALALTAAAVEGSGGEFESWMDAHGREYNGEEKQMRREAFENNMNAAKEMQEKNPKAVFGGNGLADLTTEEFATMRAEVDFDDEPKPDLFDDDKVRKAETKTLDWRMKNAVNPVVDQGLCASGWAHAAIATLEGQRAFGGWDNELLSTEEFLRCDHLDDGCKGGRSTTALEWLNEVDGIHTADQYPITDPTSTARCSRRSKPKPLFSLKGVGHLPDDEGQILVFLAILGPVATHMCSSTLLTYKSGIITECSCDSTVDHAVAIVGFGEEDGMKYWIVKNSWGTSWGEMGYARIEYGKKHCRLDTSPTFGMVDMTPTRELNFVPEEL
eukprot:TRINITY_DN9129_c0_g2_i1.p1 TRINITY_DN9129_c0_g2~~TRINITY_DN9129_c0_g2_i1.p1  ORF type:complete len:346 (+),score=63.09 TRINITY_DN9129_c0_g2_i1:47-1039(+)